MSNLPKLTSDDLYEGKSSSCGCNHAGEQFEAAAEPIANERFDAVAEDHFETPPANSPVCQPWLRLERDVPKMRRCMALAQKIGRFDDSAKLAAFLKQQADREDQEVYIAVALDTQLFYRGHAEIARGARDRVMTPIQDTARYALAFALMLGAQALAIGHNHPSGKASPSNADRDVTNAVKKMCEVNDLLWIDHVVLGLNEYYSFRDDKIFKIRSNDDQRMAAEPIAVENPIHKPSLAIAEYKPKRRRK